MPKFNIYEIYTSHPVTGESGWDIKFVRATVEGIKSFPNFDCIITVNDYPMQSDGTGIINFK